MDAKGLLAAVQEYVQGRAAEPPSEVQIHFPGGQILILPFVPSVLMPGAARSTVSAPAADEPPQLVTLSQMGSWCHRSKRTMKDYLEDLPPPFIEGGGGRAAFWQWAAVRPRLEKIFHLQLPERLPDIHRH